MILDTHRQIRAELNRIEQEHDVRILYACESGSRAWGFASRDSDFDVRFIYRHPAPWYLSIEERRDVIEVENKSHALDMSGWELRKALRLLRKSNPALLEWLNSPIVYEEDELFVAEFRRLASSFHSPRRCFCHYRSMAWGNFRGYLQSGLVRAKKYLYVVRPVLACRWIERGLGQVPMYFSELLDAVLEESEVRAQIIQLVDAKRSSDELGEIPRNEVLHTFLRQELDRLEAIRPDREDHSDPEPLNRFFQRQCLAAA